MKTEISLDEIARYIFGTPYATERDLEELENEKALFHLNRNSNLFTPQERGLFGGTEEFDENYYTPSGIIIRIIMDIIDEESIDFINTARQKVKYFPILSAHCIGETEEAYVLFELAQLDPNTGKTLEDPQPKDENLRVSPHSQEKLHYRNITSNS